MKQNVYWILLSAGLLLLIRAHAAWAEPPITPQDGPRLSSKARIAPAVPDPKVAERDADEAAVAIEARERDDELIRKEVRGPERRPDLDYDVVNGIQSINVENALRRQ